MFQGFGNIEYLRHNSSGDLPRVLKCHAAFDTGDSHVLRGLATTDEWWDSALESFRLDGSGNICVVDNTTLHNAMYLLDPEHEVSGIDGSHILDLATFLKAYLFEDRVAFIDAGTGIEAKSARVLGESSVLVPLTWAKNKPQSDLLDHLWSRAEVHCADLFRMPAWKEQSRQFWSDWTGVQLKPEEGAWPLSYRKYFSSIESVAVNHAIVGDRNLSSLQFDEFTYRMGQAQRTIVESTMRTLFYLYVGNAMSASYYSSSLRSPIKDWIVKEHDISHRTHLKHITEFIEPKLRGVASNTELAIASPVPFVLSAVLRRAGHLNEVPSLLSEMREKMAPLRAKRRELELEIHKGNSAAIEGLTKAVMEDAASLARSNFFFDDSVTGRFILSIGGARPIFGALGYLAAHFLDLPDEVKVILKSRIVKPELWALTVLSAEARQCLNFVPQFASLMESKGCGPDRHDLEKISRTLNRLSAN